MMAIIIEHGFSSADCPQCSVDALSIGSSFTQAIVVALALSGAVLEIYPSRTVQERVFLDPQRENTDANISVSQRLITAARPPSE